MTLKTFSTLTAAAMLALTAGLQAQQRDIAPGTPRPGNASIAGVVVTADQAPQPIRRALISLSNTEGTVSRSAFTDDAGRFSVTGLPDGRYNLSATKAPFLRTTYGAKRYDSGGTPITIAGGARMSDLTLRMSRGGVISGKIVDENGEPAFGVNVRVLQMRMQNGERTFANVGGTGLTSEMTDDRGLYRLFGLPPGEYIVTASPRTISGEVRAMTETEIRAVMQALAQQQAAKQAAQTPSIGGANPSQPGAAKPQTPPQPDTDKVTVTYAPVYYPGTPLATSASTVTLGAGEERAGVDFPLRLVRTTTVEGTVIVPAGIPPQSVQLQMMPVSNVPGVGMANIESLLNQRISVGPDGRFTYTAVAPGTYTISARASKSNGTVPPPPPPPPPPPGAPVTFSRTLVTAGAVGAAGGEPIFIADLGGGDPNGTPYWANVDVPVDGTPISGVTLTLQPGMTITGKVEFRSALTRPGGDFKKVQLNMVPAPTSGGVRFAGSVPGALVDEIGRLTINGVTPGRYRMVGNAPVLAGSPPGPPWRLGSVMMKGRDILDFPFDIAPNDEITDAVITFTDATQDVAGTLQDQSGRPAPDYTIIIFAADNKYWLPNARRIRSARPGTDGKYTVTGLPPGEYRMAAVTDMSPTDLYDPAFLEQLVGTSFKITLGLGEKKVQDLKISGGL